jgi:hypothetical protein
VTGTHTVQEFKNKMCYAELSSRPHPTPHIPKNLGGTHKASRVRKIFSADKGPQHSLKGLRVLIRYLKYLAANDPKPSGHFCSVNLISVQFLGNISGNLQT